MTRINVDLASMSDGIAQVKSSIGALSNHHEELKQGLHPVMNCWLGPNGSAFQENLGGYCKCYEDVLDSIVDFCNRFSSGADDYHLTQNVVTKIWS